MKIQLFSNEIHFLNEIIPMVLLPEAFQPYCKKKPMV